jgi:hypothetical protein
VFSTLVKGETFVEGQSGELRFPDDSIETWQLFVYWLFHQHMRAPDLTISDVVDCVIFADKYDVADFHDATIHKLLFFNPLCPPDEIRRVFENTSPDNPIRLYMVENAEASIRAGTLQMSDLFALDGTGFLPLFLEWRDEGKHQYTKAKKWNLEHAVARYEHFTRGAKANTLVTLMLLYSIDAL